MGTARYSTGPDADTWTRRQLTRPQRHPTRRAMLGTDPLDALPGSAPPESTAVTPLEVNIQPVEAA